MQSVSLFELASRQAQWVSAKQKAVASNIANINTQDYAPLEVAPFKEVLGATTGSVRTTHANHISASGGAGEFNVTPFERDVDETQGPKIKLEQELIEGSSAKRAYELNTAIVKAFHRMMLMTARSS